ncbi:methionine ABC transporter permease [Helicobacter sp. 11S02629-2]|uniref:methionine ABC transporter permease n=1 Tax=Helicobacter sp. 11S02629-2 TaxID=1476195 RepID=UPI000BA59E15|nr:methionine ABC transporter permease [Helicobacter sp. 11S02629-2]PAF42081.1 ABC transporter permease [Helicobacter sp. 11S02629-2]
MQTVLSFLDSIFIEVLRAIFTNQTGFLLAKSFFETLYMVFFSCVLAVIFGLPLGVFLCVSKKGGLIPMISLNKTVGSIVNVVRSFPFIILVILLIPLSRLVIGTSIGSTAAIISLFISATPFIARLFESALDEVDKGLVEASKSLGASKFTIIKMMIAESMPALINAIVVTVINLVGYSAMAGALGAGGLGDLAMREGYYKYNTEMLLYSVVLIIIMVQLIQSIGDFIVKRLRKHR